MKSKKGMIIFQFCIEDAQQQNHEQEEYCERYIALLKDFDYQVGSNAQTIDQSKFLFLEQEEMSRGKHDFLIFGYEQ